MGIATGSLFIVEDAIGKSRNEESIPRLLRLNEIFQMTKRRLLNKRKATSVRRTREAACKNYGLKHNKDNERILL